MGGQPAALVVVGAPSQPITAPLASEPTWPMLVIGIWIGGMIVMLLNGLAGFVGLYRAKRSSVAWKPADLELADLAVASRVGRSWQLRISTSESLRAAITWGFGRPVVMLPQAAHDWDPQRLRAVLLHELAHIKRFDSAVQLCSQVVCAVLWFNPAAWLATASLRSEAEAAADESVLESGVRPSDYATTLLLTAAELGKMGGRAPVAGVAFMRQGQLEKRIRAIVHPRPNRRGTTALHLLAILAAAGTVTAGLASFQTAQAQAPRKFSKEFLEGFKAGSEYKNGGPVTLTPDELRRMAERATSVGTPGHQEKIEAELAAMERLRRQSANP
jgi:beta-lactamase regulating signal transducer with metallopeptidase domain